MNSLFKFSYLPKQLSQLSTWVLSKGLQVLASPITFLFKCAFVPDFYLTIYVHIFRHFVDFMHAHLPSTNDCQKSLCHFTAAKIQYAFLHKMPFYTTVFLHYCHLTPLLIYTTAFLHYCQNTGEPLACPKQT